MIVAIDYDGTIADTNLEKVKWVKAHLGQDLSRWQCSRTNCVPLIGLTDYERMIAVVYERDSTLQAQSLPGALDAVRTLAAHDQVYIVTARPPRRIEFAREWLSMHGLLPYIAGIESSVGSSKAAICARLGAQALIEDDERHLRRAGGAGLRRVLLHYGRPDDAESRPGIDFCTTWSQVLSLLL
jgi:5'(3')-deoxyribonucleotidase